MKAFLIDNATLISALAGLVTIAGIFGGAKWGRAVMTAIAAVLGRRSQHDTGRIPKNTIKIVEHPEGRWHMAVSGKDPAMLIVSRWYVTNITDGPINILAARMLRPQTTGRVLTRRHDGNGYGHHTVPPGVTTEVSVDFWVKPPVRDEGKKFKATIVLTDQFGNDHEVKGVNFRYS